jgi:hypothetical protein
MPTITQLSADIMAVGALGTAAFGLVDSFKALPGGGISRAGLKFIRSIIVQLTPVDPNNPALEAGGLSRAAIIFSLTSQWINGTASADQLSIAKSLIKLRLTPGTAPSLAQTTGVDPVILTQVATSIANGTSLTPQQTDAYGRFDLLLTTLLDQAYQRADQRYRNVAKASAVPVAVVLAVVSAHVLRNSVAGYTDISTMQAVLLGLIATPIAPIAKDISSAIATSAQTIQTIKG